jgi:hypothetical protein
LITEQKDTNILDTLIIGCIKYDDIICKEPYKNRYSISNSLDTIVCNITFDQLTKLIFMLNKKYYENYHEWISVGFVLKNLRHVYDNEKLFNLYNNFSKQSTNKYNKNIIDNFWKRSCLETKNILTNQSLYYWCKNINLEKFNEIMNI